MGWGADAGEEMQELLLIPLDCFPVLQELGHEVSAARRCDG